MVEVDARLQEASRKLAGTGTGEMGFDPTLGNASKLAALKESFYEKLEKGGWAMIPLLGMGFAGLLVAIFKWFQLSRIRVARESDLQKVLGHLEDGRKDLALAHARSIPGPSGGLLAAAVEHCDEKKEYIEEILYERMLAARTKLERGIPFLALTATTGPLLGLLGTVMGMIATFKLISSFGSGDPKVLAAGISEALIATATGMTVAIPALLFHAFLGRIARAVVVAEQISVGFINGVPEPRDPAVPTRARPNAGRVPLPNSIPSLPSRKDKYHENRVRCGLGLADHPAHLGNRGLGDDRPRADRRRHLRDGRAPPDDPALSRHQALHRRRRETLAGGSVTGPGAGAPDDRACAPGGGIRERDRGPIPGDRERHWFPEWTGA